MKKRLRCSGLRAETDPSREGVSSVVEKRSLEGRTSPDIERRVTGVEVVRVSRGEKLLVGVRAAAGEKVKKEEKQWRHMELNTLCLRAIRIDKSALHLTESVEHAFCMTKEDREVRKKWGYGRNSTLYG